MSLCWGSYGMRWIVGSRVRGPRMVIAGRVPSGLTFRIAGVRGDSRAQRGPQEYPTCGPLRRVDATWQGNHRSPCERAHSVTLPPRAHTSTGAARHRRRGRESHSHRRRAHSCPTARRPQSTPSRCSRGLGPGGSTAGVCSSVDSSQRHHAGMVHAIHVRLGRRGLPRLGVCDPQHGSLQSMAL